MIAKVAAIRRTGSYSTPSAKARDASAAYLWPHHPGKLFLVGIGDGGQSSGGLGTEYFPTDCYLIAGTKTATRAVAVSV